MSWEVRRFDDTEAFLARARAFVLGQEVLHTVPISAVGRLRRAAEAEEDPQGSYLATVERGGEIVLAAARVPGLNLTLTTATDDDAVEPLAADVADALPDLPGVQGPAGLAERFATAWAGRGGGDWDVNMRTRLFACDRPEAPTGIHGRFRHATARDRGVLIDWLDAFQVEAVPHESRDRQARAEAVDRLLASPDPRLHLWDDDGRPVSMATNTNEPGASPRIGGVYTPPSLRRRGYAAACVAALTARLIASGHPQVVLFTDLANPTSNSVYQRIGYRPLGDYLDLSLT